MICLNDGKSRVSLWGTSPFSYSGELDTRYDIIIRSGALSVQDRRGEETTAVAQKKDFFWAGGFAKIQFQKDGNGVITGFTVSTGRVLNLKFAKLKP